MFTQLSVVHDTKQAFNELSRLVLRCVHVLRVHGRVAEGSK